MFDIVPFVLLSGAWNLVGIFFGTIVLALMIWSLVWVYSDAEARGKPGYLVALLVFLLNWPISLLLWLVVRPEPRL
ncbi:MAG TPA: hypothetical protein VEW48_09870 [Thermoanaerobaculia bacterium]|nr:hypothetical protein [Thermoanaerobaculia bacterium]